MNVRVQSGLDDVVAAETRLSRVDGGAGELLIGGYPVGELAGRATYEEVVHLLWEGTLPDAAQLAALTAALVERRTLPPIVLDVLRAAAQGAAPIDALRAGASLLGLRPSSGTGDAQDREDALTVVAAFPTIVAAYARLSAGLDPLPPRPDLGHAANYLYMLSGETPGAERVRALETYLVTVADHGLNASTFAARVIVSTGSDVLSAVIGSVGALKGPLHGGAPGPVLEMLLEIGDPARAEPYLRHKLGRGERLMGFGHRDYKVRDPRTVVLAAAAERLVQSDEGEGAALYELAQHVERMALALLEEYKPGRRLNTNLEFSVALLLHGLGLPPALFTPTFALARTAGWAAHCVEQRHVGRLIQPLSVYVGETDRRWLPRNER